MRRQVDIVEIGEHNIMWPWIIEISGDLPLKSLRTIIFQQVQPLKNGNSLQQSDTVKPENSKSKNGANIVGEIPLSGMYQDRINGEVQKASWFLHPNNKPI